MPGAPIAEAGKRGKPHRLGKVGEFCCQASPGPRLALLRHQDFRHEVYRTALRSETDFLSEVIVRS